MRCSSVSLQMSNLPSFSATMQPSKPWITTNIMVQDEFITIFPMYYAEATITSSAPIVKAINGTQPVKLAIFNNYPATTTNPSDSSEWTWWDGRYDTASGAATLKPGLNNIVIYGSCTLAIFAPSIAASISFPSTIITSAFSIASSINALKSNIASYFLTPRAGCKFNVTFKLLS